MNTSIPLKDKTAIITGGGSGIGRAIALALAKEQARVVVCGRRLDRIENTAAAIQEMGGNALAVQADVSETQDVENLVQTTLRAFGGVDILVNNAGTYEGAAIHDLDVQSWDRILQTNLRGPFLAVRAVLPYMRVRRNGHILNISSESGLEYYKGDAAYGVSKHALNDLAKYIQRENQDYMIRVNTICPGMVVTEMSENEEGLNHEKCLYPDDIADMAIWLLTRRPNVKIGTPVLIQTMLNPWE